MLSIIFIFTYLGGHTIISRAKLGLFVYIWCLIYIWWVGIFHSMFKSFYAGSIWRHVIFFFFSPASAYHASIFSAIHWRSHFQRRLRFLVRSCFLPIFRNVIDQLFHTPAAFFHYYASQILCRRSFFINTDIDAQRLLRAEPQMLSRFVNTPPASSPPWFYAFFKVVSCPRHISHYGPMREARSPLWVPCC